MKYYLKNGKVVARSYSISCGYKFELGTIGDGSRTPCVMNDFFATASFGQHSAKDLKNAERRLGEVVIIQDLEEAGEMEEQRRRCSINIAMRQMRRQGVFNTDEVRNYLLRMVEGLDGIPVLTYEQALEYYEQITA